MDAQKEGLPRNARFSAQVRTPESATPDRPDPLLPRLCCLLPPLGSGRPTVLGRRAGQVPACAVPGQLPMDEPWWGLQHSPAGCSAVLRPRGHLSCLAPGLPLR
ncbi:transmembrane protein 86B [Phyllostomus discolor]|uniref:Transmembrane protein 86B n=1 Tax=Phyllostomus discolor TaxID=89673 RepID=A0A833YI86_9CHIR|nr:transmembrane protein 86B [Phyllostomus discolor]